MRFRYRLEPLGALQGMVMKYYIMAAAKVKVKME
jgi:hypothetical protein